MKIYDKSELKVLLYEKFHSEHIHEIIDYAISALDSDKYVVVQSEFLLHNILHISSNIKKFIADIPGINIVHIYAYTQQYDDMPIDKYVTIKCKKLYLHIYTADSSGLTADEFIFKKRGILKSKKYGF